MTGGAVVVGVDGSADSVHALRWAAQQAWATARPLRAVTVLRPPEPYSSFGGWSISDHLGEEDLARARKETQDQLDEAVAGLPLEAGTAVVAVVGQPAWELLAQVGPHDHLVVGRRGHGGLDRLLLGSVSNAAVHRAPCPVTVVPGTR